MKNYSKVVLSILLGSAIIVGLNSCKNDKKDGDNMASSEPESFTYYDITDFYPGTTLIEIIPEESKGEVQLNKKTDEAAPKPVENKKPDVVADVPVQDGQLITDEETIVGGYVSLDFNNVVQSPTGNVVGDVDIVKANFVATESNGIMDVNIESVEELDEVLVKDGIENTHMMKGVVRLNGKSKDFEVPVNINKADEKFDLVGIVDFDRSHFYSDEAFSHLTPEQLVNDNVKVRVRLSADGKRGKVTIYDADTGVKDKIKFREHDSLVSTKLKEKGHGFKDKDKVMDQHNRRVEKLKEKGKGDFNKEKIEELNGKTVEKLKRRQAHLEKHKERLKLKKDEIAEKYKDKDQETGEKEKIKIDEKIGEIDAKLKEIDEDKNRLKAKGESTDGGIENPNPAGN